MHFSITFVLTALSYASAAVLDNRATDVHLAVSPKCGTLSGAPADVNAGLRPLNSYKTIVSFGDTYSDGGVQDGSPLKPPVLSPPNPRAGGRPTNGPIWAENLANSIGATFKDYATDGAVVDSSQYVYGGGPPNDFQAQVNLYIGQRGSFKPDETLYTIFFGIGDFEKNGDMQMVAQGIAYRLLVLTSSPVFARNILLVDNYGRGKNTTEGEAFKRTIFSSIASLRKLKGLNVNVGYVDFSRIWNGVLGSTPGHAAFGYTSTGACIKDISTTNGACSDPEHTFYWLPGTPSAATHRIMADYVKAVFTQCQTA